MKNKVKVLFLALLLLAGIWQLNAAGFSISGGRLIDSTGSQFILRGISHAHCWYTDRTAAAIPNIKAAGANCIRLVLSNGKRWTKTSASELGNLITLCKNNKLIAIPEVHDTTGYGEDGAACTLNDAVNYWKEVKSVLDGQEAYVIINIGNEPYGNNNAANWVADTKNAIIAMRNAGFTHTLMVDSTNWGQDWSFVSRDNAQSVFDSDTRKNTILSIHMYGVFDTAAEISSYISAYTSKGFPLVIGEFGHNHSDGNPDEDSIMSYAQSSGIGWMAWSWSGNGSGVEYLDMVTSFDPNARTSWGTRVITGANGLSSTSRQCNVFGSGGGTVAPTRTATGVTRTATRTATAASGCTPNPVTPYVQINGGTWTQTSSASVSAGGTVMFGPQPTSGTWRWSGPNGYTASTREITLSNIQSSQAGSYVATYTNACGAASSATFTLTVSGGGATPTRTATGVTRTATRTATGAATRTATVGPTVTSGGGTLCTPSGSVTIPYVKDGAGEFCWETTALGSYVNSWNLDILEINGVNYTNKWISVASIAKVNNKYVIHYKATYSWGHFEAK